VSSRPHLRALARHAGILPYYIDQGGVRREAADGTCVALLAAMGIDGSTEAAAVRSLDDLRRAAVERCTPVRVLQRRMTRALGPATMHGFQPPGAAVAWEIEIAEEGGGRRCFAAPRPRAARVGAVIHPREPLPLGYHRARFALRTADGRRYEGEHDLIVTPHRCLHPREVCGKPRAFGLLAQLYTLGSARDWGIGDLGDLTALVDWAGGIGAAFVGLNPLHALPNTKGQISPYSPTSRLFRNIIYLDVTAIPEWRDAPAIRRRAGIPSLRRKLERLRAAPHVAYDEVLRAKRPILEALHRVFAARHHGGATPRRRAYRRYLDRTKPLLREFATFVVLQERLAGRHGVDWRRWPAVYRDPGSAAVARFAAEHEREIDFHCYLQFELDRQLAQAAAGARAAGMPIGLYQDLAIGSSPTGSDAWAFQGLFLDGVTIGAPPDAWYSRGQDWGFHPLDPRRLAATGYQYWIALLRGAFAHAGALRIDHVLGLFRQFWVPVGRPPSEGAYVRIPTEDFLGILALESTRAGALVIGEDLGTVPRGVPETLAAWNILSTTVLYFARTRAGGFLPARAYPERALVSANTHDMAPLAGYWRGRDLELRQRFGQFRSAAAVRAARTERGRERHALVRRLAAEGVLGPGRGRDADAGLRGAIHAFLARTPSALLGVSLDDLTGEVEPVNVPGTGPKEYPNWSRRLRLPVDMLATDPQVKEALEGVLRSGRASRIARAGRARHARHTRRAEHVHDASGAGDTKRRVGARRGS
jgi:4-alpha-glucanotransferase